MIDWAAMSLIENMKSPPSSVSWHEPHGSFQQIHFTGASDEILLATTNPRRHLYSCDQIVVSVLPKLNCHCDESSALPNASLNRGGWSLWPCWTTTVVSDKCLTARCRSSSAMWCMQILTAPSFRHRHPTTDCGRPRAIPWTPVWQFQTWAITGRWSRLWQLYLFFGSHPDGSQHCESAPKEFVVILLFMLDTSVAICKWSWQ
jgi:hypothetical protein